MKSAEEIAKIAAGRASRMAAYSRGVKGIPAWEVRGRRALARFLVEQRAKRGWSRQVLAYRARVSEHTLGYLERAEHSPSLGVLRRLARTLEVDTLELVKLLLVAEFAEDTEPEEDTGRSEERPMT